MTRDNVLFALVGLLIGFVAAYFLYETIGEDQPPRLPAGQAAVAPGAAPPGTGMPGGAPATGPVNAPVMQQQLEQLRESLEADPENTAGWLRLANIAFDLRRWDVAVEGYSNYLDRTAPDPDVLSDLAVSLHRAGRTEDALATFDRAQELAPDHWQSYYNEVVVIGLDLGRFDEAAEILEQLQRLQPDNPDVQRLAQELERRRGSA